MSNWIFALLIFLAGLPAIAQVHCGMVEIEQSSASNVLMSFDNFTKYNGGYVLNNIAKIKVTVEDKAVIDPLCSWHLSMTIDNNAGAGTPNNEWEQLGLYGAGAGQNPTIDALEIRVRNNCATSPINGTFTTFTNHMDLIEIIAPMLPVTPAGGCNLNTNGAGSYLTNYDEFTFTIDVRVRPGYDFNPGIFMLNIKFRLEENL